MISKRFLQTVTTASSSSSTKRRYCCCLSNSTNYCLDDMMMFNQQQKQQQQQEHQNITRDYYTTSSSSSLSSFILHLKHQKQQRQQYQNVFTQSTYRSYHKTTTIPENYYTSNDKNNKSVSVSSAEEQHKMFVDQLEEMKVERESIFGFTPDDKEAWSTAGSNHKFTSDFLQSIQNESNDYYNNTTNYETDLETIVTAIPKSPKTTLTSEQSQNNIINNTSFSHVSNDGQSIRMVDVGSKDYTIRTATAQTLIIFPQEVIDAFYNSSTRSSSNNNDNSNNNNNELISSKGPIFATAKIAGIMSAKRTCEIIPLCHTILLDNINIDINFSIETKTVTINCTCKTSNSKTGVEMEALVGSTVAALTIYDMTKSVSHNIILSQTKLISKSGGKRTV